MLLCEYCANKSPECGLESSWTGRLRWIGYCGKMGVQWRPLFLILELVGGLVAESGVQDEAEDEERRDEEV